MGKVERGERRVTNDEMLGLSYALQTSIAALMSPADDDQIVDLPSGEQLPVESVQLLAHGYNDGVVQWDGDVPVFSRPGPDKPPWIVEPAFAEAVTQSRRRQAWEALSAEAKAQLRNRETSNAALIAGADLPPAEGEDLQPVVAAIVTSDRASWSAAVTTASRRGRSSRASRSLGEQPGGHRDPRGQGGDRAAGRGRRGASASGCTRRPAAR